MTKKMGCSLIPVDGRIPAITTVWMVQKPVVNNGRFRHNQPQLIAGFLNHQQYQLGVSKNREPQNGWVYNGKPYFLMDDLGGKNPIFGVPSS